MARESKTVPGLYFKEPGDKEPLEPLPLDSEALELLEILSKGIGKVKSSENIENDLIKYFFAGVGS